MSKVIGNLYNNKITEYYSSIRYEIEHLLPDFSKNVLDIGCGDGSTLNWLKSNNKCENIYGVEISDASCLKAKKILNDVVNVNVEDDVDLFPGKVFELILILDTLEHLVNPWNFLKKIKSKLSDNGSIIISIPNIRHYSIIINLFIKGEWEYEESGILDNTHLRFFTKKSLFKIFEESDLKIIQVKKYPIDFNGKAKIFNSLSLGLFSDFLTQQYMFKLKK